MRPRTKARNFRSSVRPQEKEPSKMFIIHETKSDKIFECNEARKNQYAEAKKKDKTVTLEIYEITKQKNGDLKLTKA